MKKSLYLVFSVLMISASCWLRAPRLLPYHQRLAHPQQQPRPPAAATQAPAAAANPGLQLDAAKVAPQFFSDADYQKSSSI